MIIFIHKTNNVWGYVQREADVPADNSVTWEQNFTDLSDNEEKYFGSECLTFDESSKTATFDREYFNANIRNVIYTDNETDDGKQIKWLKSRIAAYPSIGDQMDMIYKDQINSTTTWSDAVAAAKSSTPKPTQLKQYQNQKRHLEQTIDYI